MTTGPFGAIRDSHGNVSTRAFAAGSWWARGDLNFGERMFDPSVQYHPVPPDLGLKGYVVVDRAGENLWMLNHPVEIR